jgi:formamidopyrimidine-DNA glycosylase
VPELPDVTVYVERLRAMVVGHALGGIRMPSPFVLRSVDPPPSALIGRTLTGAGHIGKRIVLDFGDLHAVIHLMIAGRLRWRPPAAKLPGKLALAAFDFDHGTLLLTEASKRKRASLHVVRGAEALADFERGGIDVLAASPAAFAAALRAENHTVKRALTDPTVVDGVGNAYSDEILHRARMSPFRQTAQMSDDDLAALQRACQETLTAWTDRLRADVGDGFPEQVTAFRPEMAVHGKYRQPCPVCGSPVQRIVYAANEANYCATCQTGGRLLADRALSRLLKANWPRTLEELEERRRPPGGAPTAK